MIRNPDPEEIENDARAQRFVSRMLSLLSEFIADATSADRAPGISVTDGICNLDEFPQVDPIPGLDACEVVARMVFPDCPSGADHEGAFQIARVYLEANNRSAAFLTACAVAVHRYNLACKATKGGQSNV